LRAPRCDRPGRPLPRPRRLRAARSPTGDGRPDHPCPPRPPDQRTRYRWRRLRERRARLGRRVTIDGSRMTEAPKDPQVAEYIEAMSAWRPEFEALRPILLRAGLDEDFKWRKPCYTHDGSNVVIF